MSSTDANHDAVMFSSSEHDTAQPPPPAPPLPPQSTARYGQRAATAIARFTQPFFSGSRIAVRDGRTTESLRAHHEAGLIRYSSCEAIVDNSLHVYSSHHSFSASRKEVVHKTGLPISAIDISPYKTHAILAGRDILKTVRVDDATCTEDVNLRSRIIAYASTHDSNRDAITAQHRDQLTAVDVKWSHGNYDSTIATAAANGRIVIYDLNRPSVEIARLHEHTRQVHRIAFNPHQGAFLLSASQDGTTRLWDLRALGGGDTGGRSIRTCVSWKRYSANTEGVRDVQWSPSDGYNFAIGTENGLIQKWTLTKESSPLLRLHGHDHLCSAIAWHPEGRYLASGSTENLVKIWDFGLDDRRMKPICSIRTPQAVMHVKWRPSTCKNDGNSLDSAVNQIATSYDTKDPRIHVWDLQRPSVPILEVEKHDTPVTGMAWYSKDLLWTVGHTGTFTQNDMKLAADPTSRHASALAIGPAGRIAFFSSRKSKHSFVPESITSYLANGNNTIGHVPSGNQDSKDVSPDDQANDISIHRRRQRVDDLPSGESFGSTTSVEEERSQKLEELRTLLSPSFRSTQLASIISLPPISDARKFAYLAENYKLPSHKLLTGRDALAHESIQMDFEENAFFAELVGDIRLAQTWRILSQAVRDELCRRLEASKEARRNQVETRNLSPHEKENANVVREPSNPVDTPSPVAKALASSLSTPLAGPDQDPSMLRSSIKDNFSLSSTSGVSEQSHADSSEMSAPSFEAFGSAALANRKGDAMISTLTTPSYKAKDTKERQRITSFFPSMPSLEDDLEERRNALGSYRARPRTVLNLDASYGVHESSIMAPLDRYDSNESFQMFSASGDSDQPSFPMDESFDERKSLAQSFNASYQASILLGHPRTRLEDLGEDDGHTTPQIIEPQEASDNNHLPIVEEINVQPTKILKPLQPVQRSAIPQKPIVHKADFTASEATGSELSPILSLGFRHDSKIQNPLPWNIYSLLQPLLKFQIDTLGDSQLPTILSLWLYQFFPTEFERAQITALALFYYRRLSTLELFEPLAQLRKCYKLLFPEVLEYTTGSDPATIFCRTCRTTWDRQSDLTTCPHCKTQAGICSICESNTPPPYLSEASHATSKLWSWCQGCGHGGHAICLSSWFSQSEISQGTCPMLGCNHDCVAGPRREQVVNEIELQRRRSRKSVVKDEWMVIESRAVEKARDIVGIGSGSEKIGKRSGKSNTNSSTRIDTTVGGGGNVSNGGRRVRLRVGEGNIPAPLQNGRG